MIKKNLTVLLVVIVMIAGCGGGSNPTTGGSDPTTGGSNPTTGGSNPTTGGSNPTTGGSTPPNFSISGVAAVGNAIVDGTVTAKCISGASVVGKTATDGSFNLSMNGGQTAPCILRVTGNTPVITLHGFATIAGQANITPVTDMVLSKSLGSNPTIAFDNFDATKASTIVAGIGLSKTAINTSLSTANLGTPTIDFVNGVFKVGDDNDRILDALSIALSASGKNIDDLRIAAAAGTPIATLFSGGASSMLSTLFRPTRVGFVTGISDSATGAQAWLGVPYAKPPTGSLRWMPPVDPERWGTKTTQQFGNGCAQTGAFFDAPFAGQTFTLALKDTLGQSVGSEDCLSLNIWRPNTTASNLPVLFYIHGGSNKSGWSGQYPGARLAAEQNVVVVTVNYRMNVFGWLNHPALKTGDPIADSGNFGTLDLIQALKFVKSNIAAFGGNPANVTLSGQSSGGSDALSLVVSPLAANLFHKAMIISGIVRGNSPASSQQFATVLLENLVVRDGLATDLTSADAFLATKDNAWIKTYLYGKSAADLSSMLGKAATTNMPVVAAAPPSILYDGVVQPVGTSSDDAIAAITKGIFNNVPLLIGATNEEGKIFNSPTWTESGSQRFTRMFNFDPDNPNAAPVTLLTDLIKSAYLPETSGPTGTCGQIGYIAGYNYYANVCGSVGSGGNPATTASYWSGQAQLLNAFQSKQAAIYAYNFSWAQQPAPWNVYFGAAHTSDLPFIFGNFDRGWISFGFSKANKPGREALALTMRNAVGSFMRTGNPNNASLGVAWRAWTPASGNPKRLIFDADQANTRILMSSAESPTL